LLASPSSLLFVLPLVTEAAPRAAQSSAPILDKEAVGTRIGIGDCAPAMTTAGR